MTHFDMLHPSVRFWPRFGHDMSTPCYVPQTSEAKRSDNFIFGSEANPPKVVGAHLRCADVHLKGAPHPKGGVHEPRSEAESAVRKENSRTCTRRVHSHAHVHGADSAHKSCRAPEGCTHTHPKGALTCTRARCG